MIYEKSKRVSIVKCVALQKSRLMCSWRKIVSLDSDLSRGYTSDILLAMVMRFFWKLSRRRRAVVATLGDKVRDFVARNSTHWNSRDFFSAIFSAVASPVRRWLHMRFLPRAGDATVLKKSHHHRKQKNCPCSRGFIHWAKSSTLWTTGTRNTSNLDKTILKNKTEQVVWRQTTGLRRWKWIAVNRIWFPDRWSGYPNYSFRERWALSGYFQSWKQAHGHTKEKNTICSKRKAKSAQYFAGGKKT